MSLAAVSALAIYTIFFITPMYVDFFARHTEANLIKIASQMSTFLAEKPEINRDLSRDPEFVRQMVERVMKTVDLWKIKVFVPSGELVFSTNPDEVGEMTNKEFFPQLLETGEAHTAIMVDSVKDKEGHIDELTLVETYVPIMRNGKAIGVFEIYYNITGLKKEVSRLSMRITATLLAVCLGLLAAMIVVAVRAASSLNERELAQREKEFMEKKLIEADKKEAIATLASGVAHDFNNILTAVLGYVSLAKLKASPNSDIHQILEDANKSSLIAKDLTKQLVSITSDIPLSMKKMDTAKLISKASPSSQESSRVKLFFIIPDNLWPVEADENLLVQALHSVVNNADQAMPNGGTVTIRARNVEFKEQEKVTLPRGRYVDISVEDRGMGIAEEQIDKIFDPYFTTKGKSSRRGLGLGLAFCHSVIKKHGGEISVVSTLGEGTTVHVYLPAAKD